MTAKSIFSIVLILLATCIHSCEHKPRIVPIPGGDSDTTISDTCNPDTVYFINEILPLIRSNCAQSGCHDAVTHKEGVQLDNYSNIIRTGEIKPGEPNSGDLYKLITSTDPSKRMPPGGNLPQDVIDKIRLWILQGAKNNYCNSGCDSTRFAYSADISRIISTNCVACHSSGNVLLNSYAGVKTMADNGRLLGAIRHMPGYQPMPNAGTTLSSCDINKIKKWIDNGAPNN